MSLDIELVVYHKVPNYDNKELEIEPEIVYDGNITHNLRKMADEAGIYYAMWRPEEKGYKKAKDITPILRKGLKDLKERPDHYRKFDSPNGWGLYDNFVPFVVQYLKACELYPESEIEVSR